MSVRSFQFTPSIRPFVLWSFSVNNIPWLLVAAVANGGSASSFSSHYLLLLSFLIICFVSTSSLFFWFLSSILLLYLFFSLIFDILPLSYAFFFALFLNGSTDWNAVKLDKVGLDGSDKFVTKFYQIQRYRILEYSHWFLDNRIALSHPHTVAGISDYDFFHFFP